MDARVTLALMANAKLVFEQPDTALSFLVPPFALSTGEMRAVAGRLADPADAGAAYAFARLVNQGPPGPVSSGAADTMLWRVCDDILHRSGEIARVERSASDEASFRAAEKVLFHVDGEGLRVPSPGAKLYAQYRDAWFTAQQAYRARKLAAQSPAADPTLGAAWAADEPRLRADIAAIEAEWREKGSRAEVETAQATIAMLGTRDPVLQWDRWGQSLRFFLDSQTDVPSQDQFCPTAYSPGDVVDSPGWIEFNLSGAQFEQLIKDAPAELRTRLDPSGTGPKVSKLSFACTTVGVTRPWFESEIFRARFWRFADAGRQLSDGGSPPRGEWPAYVSGLVLARNLSVDLLPSPVAADSDPPAIVRDHRTPGAIVRDHRIPDLAAARTRERATPMPAAFVAPPQPRFERRMLIAAERRVKPVPAAVLSTLHAAQVNRMDRAIVAVTGLTPPATTTAPASDEILILAFICRPLQKCPNPDPALFPN